MQKKKVDVKICVGTACFVQGGADLLLYNDFLDPEIVERCEIEGSSCLDVIDSHPEWLGSPFIVEAEYLRDTNETAWRWEYLGR